MPNRMESTNRAVMAQSTLWRRVVDHLATALAACTALLVIAPLLPSLLTLCIKGASSLNWGF